MAIDILFQQGPEIILVKINGNNILFGNTALGARLATIDRLQLSKTGVEKEFPDLKDNPLWKEEAIKRFKEKVANLEPERKKADYIIQDLQLHGFIPIKMQQAGFRPVNL